MKDNNKEILTELNKIRKNILLGIDEKDLLYIKMQVNRIDNLIYRLSELDRDRRRAKQT